MARVVLKPGHVRPIFSGHPWIFQQAIQSVEGGPAPGDEVAVSDPSGRPLGRGFYSPTSAIPVRLFTHRDIPVDAALLRARFVRAVELRRSLGLPGDGTTAFRLVHGEGDALPGLIVDVLGDVVCVQLNTVGVKRREGLVFDAIQEAVSPRAIIDRTSETAARMEGVPAGAGVVRGANVERLVFEERGFAYEIPLALGQKTGFYLTSAICAHASSRCRAGAACSTPTRTSEPSRSRRLAEEPRACWRSIRARWPPRWPPRPHAGTG